MTPKERAAMQQALIYLDAIINGEGVKPYQLEGTAFTLREALDHYGEADEMVGCAYCNNPLFAGTKCNNCGFITLAEQAEPNSTFMEGYRIGLAEMREKCAKACEEIEQDRWNLYKGRPPYTGSESGRADPHEQGVSMGAGECATAIRAIKFEGDTGFRPVSEMIAEHKQDPKKAAAIEKAKMRKAEQKPVAKRFEKMHANGDVWITTIAAAAIARNAAPVQQVDLTDDEIERALDAAKVPELPDGYKSVDLEIARAVIAKYKEKNRG